MRSIAAITDAFAAWLHAEREQVALWLPVFMGAGVLAYYALRFEPVAWAGIAAAVPAAGLAIVFPAGRLLLAPVAAAAIGFAAGQFATARAPPIETDLPRRATVVSGTVKAVEALPEGWRITIQPASVDGEALRRSVRVRLQNKDTGAVTAGDTVRLRALVRAPAPPAYPGGWDLQRDAFYAGLGASGYALGKVERTAEAVPSAPLRFMQWLRETIAQRIRAVTPGSAGEFAVTLLTGASMAIPADDHAAFRDSGLAHLLAVAGLHIGIVMGFVLTVSRLGFALSEHASLHWPTKKLAALCAVAAGAGYMVLTGMHVPIIRSFTMASLFTVAVLADRRPLSMRGLALAGVVLMLAAPQEVPNVSFQMSFSAVLALIAGYEALRPWLRRLHGHAWHRRLASHVVALALTSALAGSASAPYGAYHFGHVQVYFVLANMVAVPLTAMWVMPAGLIALALMPLHLEALALIPMRWGSEAVLWVARATSSLPAATFDVPHMPAWGLALFSLGLAWLGIWRHWMRLAGIAAMLVGLASALVTYPPDLLVSDDGRLIAVRTPEGAFLQQSKGGSRFVRDAWAQFWAVKSFQMMPNNSPATHPSGLGAGRLASAGAADRLTPDGDRQAQGNEANRPASDGKPAGDMEPIVCGNGACLLRPYPDRHGAMLARGERHPEFCREISVIVSAEPARGLCPKPWPALVDRFTVWRYGSTAVWLEPDGARILTDRRERGDRPWVPPVPKPRTVRPTLPPAMMDRPEPVAAEPASIPAETDNPPAIDEQSMPAERDANSRDAASSISDRESLRMTNGVPHDLTER